MNVSKDREKGSDILLKLFDKSPEKLTQGNIIYS